MLRQSDEKKEMKRLAKEAAAEGKAEKAEARRLEHEEKERERQREAFLHSPAGRARQAFEGGEAVFQYAMAVHQTKANVVAMAGAFTNSKETSDPTDILNSICREGWELVNGSFVFLELGSESRDKFMASGQQIAVKGNIRGYYLFKRCDENKCDMKMPWEVTAAEEVPRASEPQPVA